MLIADITSVVCGMGIGLLGRKSQQRRSDFLLLGELFTNLKLFPFMVREVINDDTDLNSVTQNGIYQLINANGENTPTGWGMLVVFANGGYGLQIVSNVSKDTVVKLRTMNENGFNDWKTVSLT